MKYTTDYVPPFNGNYLPKDSDYRDWIITAMVIYRPRSNRTDTEDTICNGSYQMFWPVNPWNELEKIPLDF